MKIDIQNAPTETTVFILFLAILLLFTARKFATNHSFTPLLTTELKGFAILAIIFSHIGYFLSQDTRFLFPLSTIAGVGVNLFLFLSGLGLTFSTLKSNSGLLGFYKKRLLKLFTPMWLVLTFFLLTDLFLLQINYPFRVIIQSYLGFFPRADLFQSLDSPLWYFSLILFYYLLFPIVFHRKLAYFSSAILLLVPFLLFKLPLPIDENVTNLYKTHFVSFPLGVFFALLIQDGKLALLRFHVKNIFLRSNLVFILIPIFIGIFAYTSINSGVGLDKEIEQTISLITMFSIIFVFMAKNIRFGFLELFGKYSYEIYLIHWPLLARYDLFYKYLPASLATILYLVEFLLLAYLLRKLTQKLILKKI